MLGLNGTGATLSLGDVIDGGTGTDTLKISSDNATVTMGKATISNIENLEINQDAVGAVAATAVALNAIAYTQVTVEGVAGVDAGADTFALTGAVASSKIILKDLADVATTITYTGVSGTADTATVEIAGSTEDATTAGENDLTIANIETLNLSFTTAANDLDVVTAAAAKTVNITVGTDGDATLRSAAALGAATAVNIDATGDLTLAATAALANDAVITVTGAGDVDLFTLDDNGAGEGVTVSASAMTGGLTVTGGANTVSITSGAGADSVTTGDETTKVATGAGDDTVDMNGQDYGAVTAGTLDGGDGTDVIVINDGALLDADTAKNISNFEILDIAGAAASTYDMTKETSLTAVQVTAALVGAAVIDEAAAGTNLTIKTGDADLATGSLITYDLKTDTTADALTINLATNDDADEAATKDTTASAEEVTVTDFTADDIETLTINATVTNVDADNKATDYIHVVTNATLADTTTLVVTGNASLTITDIDSATLLSKVDASASTGNVTIDLANAGTGKAVTYLGGSGVDDIDASANGDLLVGNGGADVFVLGAGKDTVRYAADADSTLTLTDANSDGTSDGLKGFDTVTGFTTGTDKIELSSALGLATGDARTAFTNKGIQVEASDLDGAALTSGVAALLQTLVGTGADFFSDGSTDRATAIWAYNDTDAADDQVYLFVDSNADGNFTQGTDTVIKLAGITSIVVTDIQFG